MNDRLTGVRMRFGRGAWRGVAVTPGRAETTPKFGHEFRAVINQENLAMNPPRIEDEIRPWCVTWRSSNTQARGADTGIWA
jgi:hypothetical protein